MRPKQHSAQLVSQGAYGCIYRPSLRCGPGKLAAAAGRGSNNKYLSKLQRAGRAARTEIDIGARVARLPHFAQRFAPVVSSCPVTRAQIPRNDRAFRSCKPIQPKKSSSSQKTAPTDLVLMKMPVAGELTLAAYLSERRRRNGGRLPVSRLSDLWRALVDSVAMLNGRAQVLHYDLKDNNIMYHRGRHAPVIIDFGLSIFVPALLRGGDDGEGEDEDAAATLWREAFYAFQPDYPPWCPESVLCSALWQGTAEKKKEEDDDMKKKKKAGQNDAAEEAAMLMVGGGGDGDGVPPPRLLLPSDVLGPDDVAALRQTVDACFQRHPTLRALLKRGSTALDAKRQRLHGLASDCLGRTRLDASRRILGGSWQTWDRFALAGIFQYYHRESDEDEDEDEDAEVFWQSIEADVIA